MGFSWQSTLFKPVFNFSTINEFFLAYIPVQYERLAQGNGIDIGAYGLYQASAHHAMGLRIHIRHRYDYYYGGYQSDDFPTMPYQEVVKSYFLDAGAALVFTFRNRRNRDWLFEGGYTLNQVGKKERFDLQKWSGMGPSDYEVKFQYGSYNFGISYDLRPVFRKRLVWNLGLVTNYIPRGHPAYPFRDFMSLGLRTHLRLK